LGALTSLSEPIELSRQAELIAREIGIPPCPAILARFAAEMRGPDPDLRRLAGLTSADAALSAAMIKTVNSPFYGLASKVTNVHQALSVLGMRASANLVTGLVLRNAFPAGASAHMQRFWDASTKVAQAAAEVARRVAGVDPDAAHTFALFRDCGIAVMLGKFPAYAGIVDRLDSSPGAPVLVLEDERFRFNHARVGYALARGWMLPETMSLAILRHHAVDPAAGGGAGAEDADERLIAIGLLAEQIVSLRAGNGLRPDWTIGEAFALDTLGLSADDVVGLVREPALECA
jgi:HD-like signal output (HDOD) protein